MLMLLSPKLQRFAYILKNLEQSGHLFQLKLMELTTSSSENLQEDILEINQLIAPSEIRLNEFGQYHLNYPFLYNLKFAYASLLKASSTWQLLEEIFFYSHSQESLAEKLFMSKSTLKRKIKNINHNLQRANLQIETRPYRIAGEMSNVATFMSNYFNERYLEEEIPFPKSDYEMARQVLVYVIRHEQLSLPDYSEGHRIFKLLTYIHLLKTYDEHPKEPLNRKREIGNIWDNFIWHFDLCDSETVIKQLIYQILEMEEAFDVLPKVENKQADLAYKFDCFLQTLSKELQVPINENDRERIGLKMRFFGKRVLSGEHTYRILSNPYVEYFEKSLYLEKKLSEFLITRFIDFFGCKLDPIESYEMSYLIIVFWENLLSILEFRIRKPRFAIVLDDYPEQISSYYDLMLIYYGNRAQFELIELSEWSKQDLSDYDCVITNSHKLAKKILDTDILLISTGLCEVNRQIIQEKKATITKELIDSYFEQIMNGSKRGSISERDELFLAEIACIIKGR